MKNPNKKVDKKFHLIEAYKKLDLNRSNVYSFEQKEFVLDKIFEKELKVKALKLNNAQYIDIGTSDELDVALKKFHL